MRRRPRTSKLLALLSLLLGAATTLILRGHLARLEARAADPAGAVPVAVAAGPLERGTVLAPQMLSVRRMPAEYAPPGAIAEPRLAAGLTLSAGVAEGEPVTRSRLAAGGPVAALVPEGLRAVSVTVAIPPGMVVPGDRVDVLATFADGRPFAERVADEAEVVRVGPAPAGDGGPAAALVLLVDGETASGLAHARAFADLTVAVTPP